MALKQFLEVRLDDRHEAEDLVQELFFRLKNSANPGSIRNPTAYLYQMALNLAYDRRRQRQRSQVREGQWLDCHREMVGSESVAIVTSAETGYAAKQRLAIAAQAIDALPPQCRRVFIMHKIEGHTHAEIAAHLGISRSSVEKHIAVAIRRLAERLLPDR